MGLTGNSSPPKSNWGRGGGGDAPNYRGTPTNSIAGNVNGGLNPNTGLGGIYDNLTNSLPGAQREGNYYHGGTYDAAEDYYRTLNGPALANLQNQAAQAAGRLGAINNNIGAQKGSASAINNLQGRKIDNNIASNAVDINAIPRMQSLFAALESRNS